MRGESPPGTKMPGMTPIRIFRGRWRPILLGALATGAALLAPAIGVAAPTPPATQQTPSSEMAAGSPTPKIVTWQRARVNDTTKTLRGTNAVPVRIRARTIGAGGYAKLNLSVRASTKRGAVRKKSWVLYGRDGTFGALRVPLARGVTTVRTVSSAPNRIEVVRASANRVRFWKVCVDGRLPLQHDGRGEYCHVFHAAQVRVKQTTRIVHLPRPKLLGVTDLGAIRPMCNVGEQRKEIAPDDDTVRLTMRCDDHVARRNESDELAERRYRLRLQLPTARGGKRIASAVITMEGQGQREPDWVVIGREEPPAPTATVTDISLVPLDGLDDIFARQVRGTVTNSSWLRCDANVNVAGTEGEAYAGSFDLAPGETREWLIESFPVYIRGLPQPSATAGCANWGSAPGR